MIRKKIIVVGGGTAGSVISARLSNNFHVTVFEQSQNKNLPYFNSIPLLIGLLYNKPNQFVKKIQLAYDENRKVPFFVSKILGGSSVMNGAVHVAGSRIAWGGLLKRFELTMEDLEASYNNLFSKTSERNKINLRKAKRSSVDEAFFKALEKMNVPKGEVEWMNSQESGTVYNTVNRVFRSSVNNLNPFKSAAVKINHKIQHLLVDDNSNVVGVISNGKQFFADFVILSGGVMGSNALLQMKAIRVSDMSFVDLDLNSGKGLKDHTNLRVNVYAAKKINSLNEISASLNKKILLFISHLLGLKTLMMGTGASSAAHLDIDGDGIVDTRIQMLNFSETGRVGSNGDLFSTRKPGFSISITVVNPKSQGEIIWGSDEVLIRPNYLSNIYDIKHLKKTLKFVGKVLESESFISLVKHIDQADKIKNDPEGYIRSNCYSGYHLIGGCSHLVDRDFKVTSLNRLYICDASIMREYVSSNIHSSVALLADMFSLKFTKQNIA
jgi:choline dehydrogenase-like flavoprotein